MKKVALVFVVAVLLPSLVLAWLAVRSLRDQQFLLERQQSLLCQRVTDALAQNISDHLAQWQQEFGAQVENLAGEKDAREVAAQFDNQIRQSWPLAEVGFCVTVSGKILSPAATARDEAKTFYSDNGAFLGNRETAEVYGNNNSTRNAAQNFSHPSSSQSLAQNSFSSGGFGGGGRSQSSAEQTVALNAPAAAPPQDNLTLDSTAKALPQEKMQSDKPNTAAASGAIQSLAEPKIAASKDRQTQSRVSQVNENTFNYKTAQTRKVSPQSAAY